MNADQMSGFGQNPGIWRRRKIAAVVKAKDWNVQRSAESAH